MTKENALEILQANLWGAVMTPNGPVVQDMSKAFLMERDREFPMDHFVILVSMEGKPAFDVAEALCSKDRVLLSQNGATNYIPVKGNEEDEDTSTGLRDIDGERGEPV